MGEHFGEAVAFLTRLGIVLPPGVDDGELGRAFHRAQSEGGRDGAVALRVALERLGLRLQLTPMTQPRLL